MAMKGSGPNPRVLEWARISAGLSLEDVASAIRKDPVTVAAWESGRLSPTYPQLEKLAYRIYRRPLAVFFFPEPPEETDWRKSFRTLPEFEFDALLADTRYALRSAMASQIAVRELCDGRTPAANPLLAVVSASLSRSTASLAARVRAHLSVSLEQQDRWRDAETAFREWRSRLEGAGIFVFRRPFKQAGISGFCLKDTEFPLIVVNSGTTHTRQIFTLFHELGHLLLNENGITFDDLSYAMSLKGSSRRVETFCNQFAADVLFPAPPMDELESIARGGEEAIRLAAGRYSVSREVVLRRLLDAGLISESAYKTQADEWNKRYVQRPKRKGGNYYANQVSYLGEAYLSLVLGNYYKGRIDLAQAAEYLHIKPRSIPGLETEMLRKGAPH